MSNYSRLSDGLKLYRDAMRVFLARTLRQSYPRGSWMKQGVLAALSSKQADNVKMAMQRTGGAPIITGEEAGGPEQFLDIHHFRPIIRYNWDRMYASVFQEMRVLDWMNEVGRERNIWAHPPAGDLKRADVNRVLDSCARVLEFVDKEVSQKVAAIRDAEDKPKPQATQQPQAPPATPKAEPSLSTGPTPTAAGRTVAGLAPWRRVIEPHPDVAGGRYVQAEFAADLAQVLQGSAEAEYQDPVEFFRRTYLTAGIRGLLVSSLRRLAGTNGEPVIQLKTAFGGGKTHSMLALYHIISGDQRLMNIEAVKETLAEAELEKPPKAAKAVLVGTYLEASKGRPKEGLGTGEVRTLWGEMAFQLLGVKGYRVVAEADAAGVAPGGDTLDQLLKATGPCVILIDELVAYIRNIHGKRNLPGGSFDSNITFIQNLTESVKRNPRAVLVASIPEPNMEIGGPVGQQVLDRLQDVFGRLEAVWQPVEAHESFEVVRRRLFTDLKDSGARDATCSAFARLYRGNPTDFPVECREVEYERRMCSSYPIHPEVFDRLYEDWSTLERFQRTRGVLRLMAAVIYQLWQAGDMSPLIMPGSVPLYAPRVRDELMRYLNEQWNAVLDEVDGNDSETARVDSENARFGQVQAARRLARTIMLGSTPGKATRGIEDVRIRLGVVQPDEPISTYNDALNRLTQRLQYIYPSGQGRFWLDVQPNLTRTWTDRSSRVTDKEAFEHLEGRLKDMRLGKVDFGGIHVCPETTDDVPDESLVRLVVLSPRYVHGRNGGGSSALEQAKQILESRGTSPRRYRNMLVFAAAEADSVQRLVEETKGYLAWQSIQKDQEALNLDRAQQRRVKEALDGADKSVQAQINDAYQYAFTPRQQGTAPLEWETVLLRGGDLGSTGNMVQRASYRLQHDEKLILNLSPLLLKGELDSYLWKDGRPHISVKQLWDYYATYPYLSRLRDKDVLLATIKAGVHHKDHFGYATGVTEDGKYSGLSFGRPAPGVYYDDASVVVRPEIAKKALEEMESEPQPVPPRPEGGTGGATGKGKEPGPVPTPARRVAKRFYGTVRLTPLRITSEAGTIAQEVVQHLEGLLGADVEVTLEITAESAEGFPDNVVRIVTENARTLKFETFGFEEE